jgi:riboflavin synthase
MFTGIIETTGRVESITNRGSGKIFSISSSITSELKEDQSIAHNGACLTVENISNGTYSVTAILETLEKTNLGTWIPGDMINIERCMQLNGRLDGHMVQGHVDATGTCTSITDMNGSWEYGISYPPEFAKLIIEKGSICLNGISLTAFNVTDSGFMVAIIPYTYEHTNMKQLSVNETVNLEFDVIGKYIQRQLATANIS